MTSRSQRGRPRARPGAPRDPGASRGPGAGSPPRPRGLPGRPARPRRPRREVDSFRWAARGVRAALVREPHLRFHAAAAVVVAVLAVLLPLSGAERAALLLAVGLVWVAELVNTAV